MRWLISLLLLSHVAGCNEVLEVNEPVRVDPATEDRDEAAATDPDQETAKEESEGDRPATPNAPTENDGDSSPLCDSGQTQCSDNVVQQCEDGRFVALGECEAACEDGHCLDGCEEGESRCDGRALQRCNAYGFYIEEAQCAGDCDAERGCVDCEAGLLSCDGRQMNACEQERYQPVQDCAFDCAIDCDGYALGHWEVVELCEDSQWKVSQYYELQPRPDLTAATCNSLLEDAPVRLAGSIEVSANGEVRSDMVIAQDTQLLWGPACFDDQEASDETCDQWASAWNLAAMMPVGETFKPATSCQPSGDNCSCLTVGQEDSLGFSALQNYCVQDDEMRLQVERRGILRLRRAPQTTWLLRAAATSADMATPMPARAAAEFGAALASDGDTLVVGATGENNLAGAVYVFVRDGAGLRQQARLVGHNTESGDYFGFAVAISGDTIAVGASDEGSASRGVNGAGNDNDAPMSGAVYVFTRSGETWIQDAYLKAHNTGAEDRFGGAIALQDDLLVVTAENEESAQTATDSDGTDNSAVASGAAYAFRRTDSGWEQEAYLKAPQPRASDFFGSGVAVADGTIAVSSREAGPDNKQDAGAVHIFVREDGQYRREGIIYPRVSDRKDFFGYASIALSGDWLAVGAPADDSLGSEPGTIAEGEEATTNAGAVWLYRRTGKDWAEADYLKAPQPAAGAYFGSGLALVGNTLLVGAEFAAAPAGATGDGVARAGGAYLYGRAGADSQFSFAHELHAPHPDAEDRFGMRVAILGAGLVVSAWGEDGGAGGVHEVIPELDANVTGNGAAEAGATYIFY